MPVEVLSKKKRVFVRGIVRLDTYTRQEVVWANQISYMPFHVEETAIFHSIVQNYTPIPK